MGFEKGNKLGKGRKPKVEEEKVNTLFQNALKTFYKVDTDNEAKQKLVHTLLESQRGQIFISEHLFGKPKETIETTHNLNNFDIKDLFKFDNNKE
jgi:hypothetical protein